MLYKTEVKVNDISIEVEYDFDDSVPSVTIERVFIDRFIGGSSRVIDITSEAMSLKTDWSAEEQIICDEHIENWAEIYVNEQNRCLG